MVMNFWEAQRQAKSKTFYYLVVFFILTTIVAALAELAMRAFAGPDYNDSGLPFVGLGFLGLTLLVAGFNYLSYKASGGAYVAESLGAQQVDPSTRHPKVRQLLNIVEEIALATSLPIPAVYILDAREINAFAAGTSPSNAAITVTTGCLHALSRDELQGVLAHEFGHVYNRDMTISMRVAAMIMGFFFVTYIGLRLLQFGSYSRRDDDENRGGNPLVLIGLILLVAGAITWFFGSILQAMVSRQREYLADACSVQYTRNPTGIAGALKKILQSQISDMPRNGQAFSHMYFNEHESFFAKLFASHPPLEDRILAIEGGEYSDSEPIASIRATPPPPPPLFK
jgi:heat shock protein HtpX